MAPLLIPARKLVVQSYLLVTQERDQNGDDSSKNALFLMMFINRIVYRSSLISEI